MSLLANSKYIWCLPNYRQESPADESAGMNWLFQDWLNTNLEIFLYVLQKAILMLHQIV